MTRCAEAHIDYEAEFRFQRPDGGTRWVHSVATPLHHDNQIVGWVGANEDVTDRRIAHEALSASEQRFRTLAATLPVGVYETDARGIITYVNYTWMRIAGCKDLPAHGNEWIEHVHPENRESLLRAWSHAINDQADFSLEFRFQHPDGTIRWVHSSATLIEREHRASGYVGVNEDITAQRDSIQRMAASLSEKEVLLREVHHRVKNNLQLVTSLLNLQAGYIKDASVLEGFRESQRRVRAMALVHEMLYAHTSLARIQIDVYFKPLAQTIIRSFPNASSGITLEGNIAPLALLPDVTIPLGLIVNELLTNACKHGLATQSELTLTLSVSNWRQEESLSYSPTTDRACLPISIRLKPNPWVSDWSTSCANNSAPISRPLPPEGPPGTSYISRPINPILSHERLHSHSCRRRRSHPRRRSTRNPRATILPRPGYRRQCRRCLCTRPRPAARSCHDGQSGRRRDPVC
ncbi:MAG: PAS domain-containing protein [Candidatus Synoicihabitans palmerolidicus]|nr:PAS domain-containing protein [Candidatus Synoicihabitans palmerolidicus]